MVKKEVVNLLQLTSGSRVSQSSRSVSQSYTFWALFFVFVLLGFWLFWGFLFFWGRGAGSFFFTLSFISKETSFCFELEDHGILLLF
jgi:hypothetical protein